MLHLLYAMPHSLFTLSHLLSQICYCTCSFSLFRTAMYRDQRKLSCRARKTSQSNRAWDAFIGMSLFFNSLVNAPPGVNVDRICYYGKPATRSIAAIVTSPAKMAIHYCFATVRLFVCGDNPKQASFMAEDIAALKAAVISESSKAKALLLQKRILVPCIRLSLKMTTFGLKRKRL